MGCRRTFQHERNGGIIINYSKKRVEAAKADYPVGTRVELGSMCNFENGMPDGLRGTVAGVDDQPALLMHWDNGRSLSLLIDKDNFRKLTPEEIEIEKNKNLIAVCNQNTWLKNYRDYPDDDYPYNICKIKDMDELIEKFEHGNWGLRQAFVYADLAFVQQVNGGDEWLTLKWENGKWESFESISFEFILGHEGERGFREYMGNLLVSGFGMGMNKNGEEGMQMV